MNEHTKIENQLQYYLEQFTYLHQLVLEDSRHIVDLENLIDEYSQWILQPLAEHHYLTWNDLETKIISKMCETSRSHSRTTFVEW